MEKQINYEELSKQLNQISCPVCGFNSHNIVANNVLTTGHICLQHEEHHQKISETYKQEIKRQLDRQL